MIYYPKPLHLHKAFEYLGYKESDFPNSEKKSKKVLSLPMHTELDNEQLLYICNSIVEYFKN
jgi:dTDP-4-amino-4,6-dideoxygalactose transaminase